MRAVSDQERAIMARVRYWHQCNPYFWFTVLLSKVRTKKVQQLCFQVSDRNANELDSLLKPNPSVKKKIYFQLLDSNAQIIKRINKKNIIFHLANGSLMFWVQI